MALATKTRSKTVTFSLNAPDAKDVAISGDFNNWERTSLKRSSPKDKVWRKDFNLKPGRYEYKFVIDGNWITDPSNTNRTWNNYGSENSVIEIK